MHSDEIRRRFLAFFEKRGHAVIPSAPLVPQNDPSVLFNTAGMQPLVPYLLGQKHPAGNMLVDVQKCVRTGDLDDIGDNRHLSFFQMLGNWSLGAYFKKEAISWSYEFLTSKDEGLGLDPARLYVTVFEGDENAPEDTEAPEIWKSLGIPENRIYKLGAEDNWWSPGDNGPCGPDTEMFYDFTSGTVGDLSKEDFLAAVSREDLVEIWNDVFMEYEKKEGKVVGKLAQKNVDTGAGLERITALMQGKRSPYETDLFAEPLRIIEEEIQKQGNYNSKYSPEELIKATRITLDHFRTALFLAADGVVPSGKGRGYVMRRLVRRGYIYFNKISPFGFLFIPKMLELFVEKYGEYYPELLEVKKTSYKVIVEESEKFGKTIEQGLKELDKETEPFILVTTYGFPVETLLEIYKDKNLHFDHEDFDKKMAEHQKLSQTASAGMVKGGLAHHIEKTIRLHTAHHLLLAALQEVLGKDVKQRGSNITEERLRIDFAFDRKMTDEEKKKVEDTVNGRIQSALKVVRREMPRADAEKLGAEMEFGVKYPDVVSVYFIEDDKGTAVSKEFCGGPHVENTSELGHFKIQKEEASSQGVRRIKAILE